MEQFMSEKTVTTDEAIRLMTQFIHYYDADYSMAWLDDSGLNDTRIGALTSALVLHDRVTELCVGSHSARIGESIRQTTMLTEISSGIRLFIDYIMPDQWYCRLIGPSIESLAPFSGWDAPQPTTGIKLWYDHDEIGH